jgi:hypothetical protein
MATPAAIAKLTEHATRAKALMADTANAADKAGPILDNYEATLRRFKAGLSEVAANEKELAAMLRDMGNATDIIGTAFQDEKPDAAKASMNGEQQKAGG